MRKTGPNTPEGKAIVSQNRLSHGLRSTALVIPDVETFDEWELFHDEILAATSPRGAIETDLAERVGELLWRMRRIARAERQFLDQAQARDDTRSLQHRREVARDAARERTGDYSIKAADILEDAVAYMPPPRRLLPDDASLHKIMRYEAHLGRQLYLAMHELEALQARRNGESVPLARLDVHAASANEDRLIHALAPPSDP